MVQDFFHQQHEICSPKGLGVKKQPRLTHIFGIQTRWNTRHCPHKTIGVVFETWPRVDKQKGWRKMSIGGIVFDKQNGVCVSSFSPKRDLFFFGGYRWMQLIFTNTWLPMIFPISFPGCAVFFGFPMPTHTDQRGSPHSTPSVKNLVFNNSDCTLPETKPPQIDPLKRRFLLETTIFRFYLSFREGNISMIP